VAADGRDRPDQQARADVEGNFPKLTLEVGRRLQLDDVVVVEWTCDYGDGRLKGNVIVGELANGQTVRVTDYWGEPNLTPEWRQTLTDRLDMPGDGIWPDAEHSATTRARDPRKPTRSRIDTAQNDSSRGCGAQLEVVAGSRAAEMHRADGLSHRSQRHRLLPLRR
jgi:hypothetical protein